MCKFQGGERAFHCRGALLATKGEREITKILNEKLSPSYIEVRDISGNVCTYIGSGGCGSMYEIWIDSDQFSGKRLIQQHRMVNEVCISDNNYSLIIPYRLISSFSMFQHETLKNWKWTWGRG